MSSTWPLPNELADHLSARLPDDPHVQITPRDVYEKRCAAYAADHYEIAAYYISIGHELLSLYVALVRLPEVYLLTYAGTGRQVEPEWPINYRDKNDSFRPQVRALWRPAS